MRFYNRKRCSRQGNNQDTNELVPLNAPGIADLHPEELVIRWPLSTFTLQTPGKKSPDELLVHLPLSAFSSSSLPDMTSLYSRLTMCNVPNGWNVSLVQSCESSFLAVSKLQVTPPFNSCATYKLMLTVAPCGTWTLCAGSKLANTEHCTLLSGFPTTLCSVDDVLQIVSALENSKFCTGNPDEKFANISQRHRGVFKDYHGKNLE